MADNEIPQAVEICQKVLEEKNLGYVQKAELLTILADCYQKQGISTQALSAMNQKIW